MTHRLPAMLVAVAGVSSSCLAGLPSMANAIADPHGEWLTTQRLERATALRTSRVRLLSEDFSFHVAVDLAPSR